MKSIVLHGMAPDNAGNHHHAGKTLTVSDDVAEGCITKDEAVRLLDIQSASAVAEKAAKAD